MVFNFYASDHQLHDGRMSEHEEWDTYEEAKKRAAHLADVWDCDFVKFDESGGDEWTYADNPNRKEV